MLGAIIGDIVGSRFEWHNIKTKEFNFFNDRCHVTDDSVMTLAVVAALMSSDSKDLRGQLSRNAVFCMRKFGNRCPRAGYGGRFKQ